MKGPFAVAPWRILLLSFGVLAIITAIFVLPFDRPAEAGAKRSGEGLFRRTVSQREDLPNYDFRADKNAFEKKASYRAALNKDAVAVANLRDSMVQAEGRLRSKAPKLKIEYSPEIRTAEVIAPDVTLGRAFLSKATTERKSTALGRFLK